LQQHGAVARDVLDVEQPPIRFRHQAPQERLAFDQWQSADVASIEPQQIEGEEPRRSATSQQRPEQRAPIPPEYHDLAIQHRGPATTDRTRDRLGHSIELLEGMPPRENSRQRPAST
jgi:hypothetical protein